MVESILAWFVTSKLGRAIAAGAAIALAIGIGVLKVFSAGKQAARAEQDQQSLENIRARTEKDAEIDGLGHADLDRRMSRWVRDE